MKLDRPISGVVTLVLAALGLLSPAPGLAQSVRPDLWVTNGTVSAMTGDGTTLYIGGMFTQVGPPTGGGVPIHAGTGVPVSGFPKVTGNVNVITPDGSGGWYLGGLFTHVGGLQRSNIAHVASNLSVSGWNPGSDGAVFGIAVSGATVYAAGIFVTIGGQPRSHLAALDVSTGLATAWNPAPNNEVDVVIPNGSLVYVCGRFTNVGGQARNRIACLDASTGLATPWNPDVDGHVRTMAKRGPRLYIGGGFGAVGGFARGRIAAVDSVTGAPFTWDPGADGFVEKIVVNDSLIYVGGQFTQLGVSARSRLGVIGALGGAVLGWNPVASSTVKDIAVSGSSVYVGGAFTTIGGQPRSRLAEVDAATGGANVWNPNVNDLVNAVAVSGGTVYAGGLFTSMGGVPRNNIAALDLATGAAIAWDPNANGFVNALEMMGTTVYAGGTFANIGGQNRNRIAALDATSGLASAWDPNANGALYTLVVSGGRVLAGGEFTSIGGASRARIAALDPGTGAATGWNPGANSWVADLVVSGSTVYAAGDFTSIGGQARNFLAALDASTGLASGWNPGANGDVQSLAVSGATVYAGGSFGSIGGQSRNNLAAVDAATGLATSWNPNVDNSVRDLLVSGGTVYAAGTFLSVGGQTRRRIAAIDVSSGLATPWNPNANGIVDALRIRGPVVYAGGSFTAIAASPNSSIAALAAHPEMVSVVPPSAGNAGPVTVTVYGTGFASGSTLRLTRSGQSAIVASDVMAAADGTSMTGTLDVAGALVGLWDVVVVGPDAQSATLANGFTIEGLEAPQLRVSVLGPSLQSGNLVVRRDRRTAYDIVIENPGNVDALYVPLWLAGIPTDATVTLDFPLSYPAQAGGEPDWSTVPLYFASVAGRYVPLVIPRVPPGTMSRRVYITVPGPTHPPFVLSAAITPPWVDGNKFRSCLTAGGITNPACMGAQLETMNAALSPGIAALSGVAVWAKVAWQCEGAGTLGTALAKAEQVLDYLEEPVEGGSVGAGCEDVLATRWRGVLSVSVVGSVDPNDKLGPQGAITGVQSLPYAIRFENFASATAPAQQVVVTDQLDPSKMELSTLSLDQITFGNTRIYPPPGLKSYSTTVDLRPATNLLVNVAVSLDPFTNVLSWYFTSIDPATGEAPESISEGFLPPNVTPPQGEGSVLFTVMPKAGLTTGTVISNAASILFDDPPAMNTPSWSNGLDNTPPSSHVLALPGSSHQPSIPVSWTAVGSPPDLRDFTIYVKQDAGPYRVWRLNTTATSDTLVPPPDHQFHTFSFYSVARDQIGNIEAASGSADASTQSTTSVGGGVAPALSLAGAWPNPATGPLSVSFMLPGREHATLELLDVAGRRIVKREVGSLGPGAHVLTLAPGAGLKPGLYFLRLTRGAEVLRTRVAVIR